MATITLMHWTPAEALEQACAALPDAAFAGRYGIARETIHLVQGVVDDLRSHERGAGQASEEPVNPMDVLTALTKARAVLPQAWPENAPLALFAAVDGAIADGYREVLESYPPTLRIGERYDDDVLLSEAVNRLIPGFEYPDWSHRTVKEVQAFATQQAREGWVRRLAGEGIPLVEAGQHIGKIVAAADGIAVQATGRGAMVAHDARKWGTAPVVGEQFDIQYSGKHVEVRREAERELAGAGLAR